MSKRLQVVLSEAELDEIRDAAKRNRVTVSAWVRRTLRAARERELRGGGRRCAKPVRNTGRPNPPACGLSAWK
ncbi:MAG: antitoxin [Gemmatimonadetes bacterium]|nr:antitoxin [Gemmatimonadota bacterium]